MAQNQGLQTQETTENRPIIFYFPNYIFVSNHEKIEHLDSSKWENKPKILDGSQQNGNYPNSAITEMTLLNINEEVWSIGGYTGEFSKTCWRLVCLTVCTCWARNQDVASASPLLALAVVPCSAALQ